MATKLFVNLPVKDLGRSKAFFTRLGLDFFGQADDMASVIVSEHTQVMLLAEATFASYARNGVADAAAATEMILVLGVETREQVDPAGVLRGRDRGVRAVHAHRRADRPGEPVEHDVGEDLVLREAPLDVAVAVAPRPELLDDPRGQPGGRIGEPERGGLGFRPVHG